MGDGSGLGFMRLLSPFSLPTPRDVANDGLSAFMDDGDVLNGYPLLAAPVMSLPRFQK